MYKEFDIKELYESELRLLDSFKENNPEKEVKVYYSTYDSLGIGFKLIATTDIPKIIKMNGKCDFGNCVDITDYDERIYEI